MSQNIDDLKRLFQSHGTVMMKPVSQAVRDSCFQLIGPVPPLFSDLYALTNGFAHDWFRVLPIEDIGNPKKTWDSLQRANDPTRSKFFRDNPDILQRFMVFAEISGGNCAMLDRTDMTIWYQEGDLHQTDLNLIEFILTEFREVGELK
jgi:hypothetical protein